MVLAIKFCSFKKIIKKPNNLFLEGETENYKSAMVLNTNELSLTAKWLGLHTFTTESKGLVATLILFSKILVKDKIDIVKTADSVIWDGSQGRTSATYLSDTKKSLKYYPA